MFGKSKLQNAKQKLSKLKEKYLNNSNLNTDGFTSDLSSSTVLFDNNKPEIEQSNVHVLNEPNSPVHELISPRIEITNLFDGTEHDKSAKINSQSLCNNQNLTDASNQYSPNSHYSPSEQSYCSKNTNKTLKTESIVLSELSNQFEHICFLSSSSDEENTASFNPASLRFPQTIWNKDNSSLGLPLQTSVRSFNGNSETKQTDDVPLQKIDESSSELSEVQSYVNSTVSSDKEVESVNIYSIPANFETNNSELGVLRKEENKYAEDSENSYKTLSDKKKTSISDPNFELNSSSYTQAEDKITESSEKPLEEIKPVQHSLTKQKHHKLKNCKTTDLNNVSNFKVGTKLNYVKNSNRKFKGGEGEVIHNNRDIDRSSNVSNDNRLVHEGDSSLHKKSRRKYPKNSRTVLKHLPVTNMKPSTNRPILKSCVLIKHDTFTGENKFMPTQRTSIDGCGGYEEVINQLLLNQVQLTRHFIHSHHQMYLTCCQAVKLLSEQYSK